MDGGALTVQSLMLICLYRINGIIREKKYFKYFLLSSLRKYQEYILNFLEYLIFKIAISVDYLCFIKNKSLNDFILGLGETFQ